MIRESNDWDVELPDVYSRPPRRRRRQYRGDRWVFLGVVAALLSVICFMGRLLVDARAQLPEAGGICDQMPLSEDADTSAQAQPEQVDEGELDYILSHPELYPEKLRELAEKNEEAMNYVYQYPEKKNVSVEIDLSAEAQSDTVPLLIQWDERWGYLSYGDGLIGYTGCGPTCLSMVALYLTGDAAATPAAVAQFADRNGYYIDGSGTDWSLMSRGCEAFGVQASELSLNENTMIRALEAGHPIICSMRAGDFTDGGHFIVITGYSDGAFTVNDPNSRENSAQTWSFERLEGQIKNLWSYTALA